MHPLPTCEVTKLLRTRNTRLTFSTAYTPQIVSR